MKQGELFDGLKAGQDPTNDLRQESSLDDKFQLRLSADKIVFLTLVVFVLLIIVFTLGVEHGKRLYDKQLRGEREIESITNLARVTAAQQSISKRKLDRKGKELDHEIKRIESVRAGGTSSKSQWSKIPFLSRRKRVSELKEVEQSVPSKAQSEVISLPEPKKAEIEKKLEPTAKPVEKKLKESQKIPEKLEKSYEVRIMSVTKETYAQNEVERLGKKGIEASFRQSGDYHIVILGPYGKRKDADKALSHIQKSGTFSDAYIRRLG